MFTDFVIDDDFPDDGAGWVNRIGLQHLLNRRNAVAAEIRRKYLQDAHQLIADEGDAAIEARDLFFDLHRPEPDYVRKGALESGIVGDARGYYVFTVAEVRRSLRQERNDHAQEIDDPIDALNRWDGFGAGHRKENRRRLQQ